MTRQETDIVVATVASEHGWGAPRTARDAIAAWRSFVTRVETGYSMNIYEFENDRSVRGRIEALLNDERVAHSLGFSDFRREVLEEDSRYHALLQPDIQIMTGDDTWWERGVPRYAGHDLVSDFADLYGVVLELRTTGA